MPQNSGVYIITSPSGKSYIGSAKNFTSRWATHRRELRNRKHGNHILQNAYLKYGEDGLIFRRLIICANENLLVYEQIAIDALKPAYNISKTAGSSIGVKHTAEARYNMSRGSLGKSKTQSHRQNIKKGLYISIAAKEYHARPISIETRESLSIAQRGKKRPLLTCLKIADANRRRKLSPETRAKLSLSIKRFFEQHPEARKALSIAAQKRTSFLGMKHSEKTKRKMRAIRNTPEYRAKISVILLARNYHHSVETLAKISKASRAYHLRRKAKICARACLS